MATVIVRSSMFLVPLIQNVGCTKSYEIAFSTDESETERHA